LTIVPGQNRFDVELRVPIEAQHLAVPESDGPAVSTDPASNAGALVLRGDDLDALSDDPEDLVADLQALAGPSAGPGGGAIFVDGFSGGQLPPKQSIREIRVNPNPFSTRKRAVSYSENTTAGTIAVLIRRPPRMARSYSRLRAAARVGLAERSTPRSVTTSLIRATRAVSAASVHKRRIPEPRRNRRACSIANPADATAPQ
jgi:hypothetical protein